MGALKIECYCKENQMNEILKMVTDRIGSFDYELYNLEDIDELLNNLRVCVTFNNTTELSIISAEVLNEDWDLLYEDSAVLTSRLKPIVKEFNQRRREALKYAS